MQRFTPRTTMAFPGEPLDGLPMWFSKLLYMRGIDTNAKAEKFLRPKIEDLHDPFLMPGMEAAVALIQKAIKCDERIVVYGDYDVDGVCACAIMIKTLSKLGAKVCAYLPDRHGEGYGLNEAAVHALASSHQLLITVDCGIANHHEVSLARALGMTVIVTDHHELPPELPPAHAVLNPLMGYPYPRLCGAGVAFKLCQALCRPAMAALLPLCALATVADIVPLTDENRALVALGLLEMEKCASPGLAALMAESGTTPPLRASDLAFRLAPRLNAAGRLSHARMSLDLLLSDDPIAAGEMARVLSEENERRKKVQETMLADAIKRLPEQVDFGIDRAIIIVGEDYNPGIIGLCAGKLCEKYYYPALVLSRRGDGTLTGSARSIPGVNIHTALSMCGDLFIRFGGHAQAAGLTMKEEFLPELRRRLTYSINQIALPEAYVEQKEYDLALPFEHTTEEMVNLLWAFEPTGHLNPPPLFLARDVSVQSMRAVGREGAHLNLSLLDGETLRGGVFFSHGQLAAQPLNRVDVLYSPQLNTFRGHTSVQVTLSALIPHQGAVLIPEKEAFAGAMLKDLCAMTANCFKIPLDENAVVHPLDSSARRRLLKGVQGTLVIARSRETALAYAGELAFAQGELTDPRGFHTLLVFPQTHSLSGPYRHILLADGVLTPSEAALLARRFPHAGLYAPARVSHALRGMIDSFSLSDDALREVYKALMRMQGAALVEIASALSLAPIAVWYALAVFSQLGLISYEMQPFAYQMLPPHKISLDKSPLLRLIRSLQTG